MTAEDSLHGHCGGPDSPPVDSVPIGLDLPTGGIARGVWGGVVVLIVLAVYGIVTVVRTGGVGPGLLRLPFPSLSPSAHPVALGAPWWQASVSCCRSLAVARRLRVPLTSRSPSNPGAETNEPARHPVFIRRDDAPGIRVHLLCRNRTSTPGSKHRWRGLRRTSIPDRPRHLFSVLLACAAFLMLIPAAHEALQDAEQTLRRLGLASLP